jgi:NAD(P)-dependent dehydrogenase (short-subunit alcohol dehydrogenase family)
VGPFDLTGKVALVTGGNAGIGRALALGLRDAGAQVAIAARRTERNAAVLDELGPGASAPDGRWGQPDGLTGARVWLPSAGSGHVTGTVVTVDGGYLASYGVERAESAPATGRPARRSTWRARATTFAAR